MTAIGTIDDLAPKRFGHHDNTFGFLRLLFASLVILAHTPELYDGDRSREILTQVFGTLSFGELAVYGFFFISGYLITGSYIKSSSAKSYAIKRIVRIYPGFLVASLVCLLIVAPLGGGTIQHPAAAWLAAIARAFALQRPSLGMVFPGTYLPELDGAMWTIAYEFKCYVLVLVLGLAGILSRRKAAIAVTCALLALSIISGTHHIPSGLSKAVHTDLQFMAVFMVGACYFLFRDKVRLGPLNIAIATLMLIACMFSQSFAVAGAAIFGGLLILAAAKRASGGVLERINNENDISYGIYLYAWPITKLLLWWWPAAPMVLTGLATFALACVCGWLSWTFVEKPAMGLLRVRRSIKVASA